MASVSFLIAADDLALFVDHIFEIIAFFVAWIIILRHLIMAACVERAAKGCEFLQAVVASLLDDVL
jgi:hypothetical protein